MIVRQDWWRKVRAFLVSSSIEVNGDCLIGSRRVPIQFLSLTVPNQISQSLPFCKFLFYYTKITMYWPDSQAPSVLIFLFETPDIVGYPDLQLSVSGRTGDRIADDTRCNG
jgi:hypothetical protein